MIAAPRTEDQQAVSTGAIRERVKGVHLSEAPPKLARKWRAWFVAAPRDRFIRVAERKTSRTAPLDMLSSLPVITWVPRPSLKHLRDKLKNASGVLLLFFK
eukprot:18395-Pyramimonas_sp.AAC.1